MKLFGSHKLMLGLLALIWVKPGMAGERLSIDPTLNITEMFDSNIFLATSNPESDFVTLVQGKFDATFYLRFGDLKVAYAPRFFLHAKNFDAAGLEMLTHDAHVGLLTHLTSRLDVTLEDSFSAEAADIARPALQSANSLQVNTLSLGANYLLPLAERTRAGLDLKLGRVDVLRGASDRFSLGSSLDLMREMNGRFVVALKNGVNYLLYDDSALPSVLIYGVDVRAEYQLSDKLKFVLPLGIQLLMVDGSSPNLGFSTNLVVDWTMLANSGFQLKVAHGFTTDSQGAVFERLLAGINFKHQFRKGLEINTGFDYLSYYSEAQFAASGIDDDQLWQGNIALNYDLFYNTVVVLGAAAYLNRGDFVSNDFDAHQVFLGVTYDFVKKKQ